jgi:hypothetical protein
MSSDLNIAKKLLKDARRVAGRRPEDRLKSLCGAVEHVISHIQKSERVRLRDKPAITINGA